MRKLYGPPIPGSISPVPATDEMTEPVGIKDGQLWTKGPDGGLVEQVEALDDEINAENTGIKDRLRATEEDVDTLQMVTGTMYTDINDPSTGLKAVTQDLDEDINDPSTGLKKLVQDNTDDITALQNGKLPAPTSPGNLGDVIVLGSGDLPEWQAVAPFNPNGDYPGVSVGTATVAKNIENVSVDSGSDQTEPFFFQATATENNTGETPTAPQFELKNLRGNTIVYNQLVDGVNLTYSTISGHKYWVYVSATDYTSIVTSSGSSITISDAQKDKIVDLTRWFNGSIPSAITDDPTVFPINYYDDDLTYSAGELKNCSCTELKTVGFNQWDEIAEEGVYDRTTGQKSSGSNRLRSKNYIRVIAGKEYYFNCPTGTSIFLCYYDANKNFVTAPAGFANNIKTIPNNVSYMTFFMSSEYSYPYNPSAKPININLSWDGERDGEYSPYISHTYPMVWSGKSAGSAYDEKLPDGTETTRIGSVDLGSLNWTYSSGVFISNEISGIKSATDTVSIPNLICGKYVAVSIATIGIDDESLTVSTGKKIWVYDTDYNDPAAFKTAMSGVTLYYELATPTTSSGDAFTSVIEGDDYGTMAFDSVVPVGNEFFYPADYALLIDDLNKYVNGDVTELAKMSDIPSVVVPDPPTVDGNYTLKCDVTGGSPSLYWDNN